MDILFDYLTIRQKKKAFTVFLSYGCFDTFKGFCQAMNASLFNAETGEPVEIY